MSWADYFQCDMGHIGLHPPIIFEIGDKVYRACSQECRNNIEKREAKSTPVAEPAPPEKEKNS